MTGRYQARGLGIRDQRHIVVSRSHGAEASLREPDTLGGKLGKVLLLEPRLEDHGARDHAHAARPVVGKTTLRSDRQCLDALDVTRPAWNMNLRCRDRRRHAAMHVALQVADRLLPGV